MHLLQFVFNGFPFSSGNTERTSQSPELRLAGNINLLQNHRYVETFLWVKCYILLCSTVLRLGLEKDRVLTENNLKTA